jgi:hypothetical protein
LVTSQAEHDAAKAVLRDTAFAYVERLETEKAELELRVEEQDRRNREIELANQTLHNELNRLHESTRSISRRFTDPNGDPIYARDMVAALEKEIMRGLTLEEGVKAALVNMETITQTGVAAARRNLKDALSRAAR